MLLELNIKNFAIIEDLQIQFTKGLNLLTGETGAGKSIIIEALGIILGGRGTKNLIRTGKERAILQAVFSTRNNTDIEKILDKYGIEVDKDGILTISREIMLDYPSISRVNGRTVTLNVLNKISSHLVDIFAQHEHQSLLNIANHRVLIDSFGNGDFNRIKSDIQKNYNIYIKEKNQLKNMTMDSNQRNREIDLLKFQLNEINSANLSVDDEKHIENQYTKLSNIKEISAGLSEITDSLSSYNYASDGVIDLINRGISILDDLVKYDKSLQPLSDRFKSINFELQDLNSDLNDYLEGIDIDEEQLHFLEDRLDLIHSLKRKYGNTIEEILEYRDKISTELDILYNYEEEVNLRKQNIKKLEAKLFSLSERLSEKRKNIARKLEEDIAQELSSLNMEDVVFKVEFKKSEELTAEGIDRIKFLIATNPGEDLKPLSKIVSGGEMSRIMLAFKSILADHDKIPTLIFDEIDTGISGRTAQTVGEKIYRIAQNRQIISISHLPQIAAMADSHYVISKTLNRDGKMVTTIKKLSKKERIEELSRLIGGVDVTETTLNHAREMLEMSKKIKNKIN